MVDDPLIHLPVRGRPRVVAVDHDGHVGDDVELAGPRTLYALQATLTDARKNLVASASYLWTDVANPIDHLPDDVVGQQFAVLLDCAEVDRGRDRGDRIGHERDVGR